MGDSVCAIRIPDVACYRKSGWGYGVYPCTTCMHVQRCEVQSSVQLGMRSQCSLQCAAVQPVHFRTLRFAPQPCCGVYLYTARILCPMQLAVYGHSMYVRFCSERVRTGTSDLRHKRIWV
jgi:hypothetical protein